MAVYTTTNWYGLGKIKNTVIREKFHDEITKYLSVYTHRLASFFRNIPNTDLCDLMYVLTCDDSYFTSIQRHFWILCVGYFIITIYGHLDFSCPEHKYFYLEKITDIRIKVCYHIQGVIAKLFFTACGLFAGAAYAIYKSLC